MSEKGFILNNMQKARECINQDTCIVCRGKMNDEVINSHTVPQFILKNISQEHTYKSAYQYELKPLNNTTQGIRKAGVFRLLCGKCDKEFFKTYEEEKNYDDKEKGQKILEEIALKNHLKKYYDIASAILFMENAILEGEKMIKECSDIAEIKFRQSQINAGMGMLKYQQELLNTVTKSTIKIFNEMNSQKTTKYRVIYSEYLNYRAPIAAQGCFPHGRALAADNDKIKIRRMIATEGVSMMNSAVFPFSEKTLLVLFCRKDTKQYNAWINQFVKKSAEEKLNIINNLIFTELDDYFVDKNSKIKIEIPEVKGTVTNKKLMDRKFKFDNYLSEKYKIE